MSITWWCLVIVLDHFDVKNKGQCYMYRYGVNGRIYSILIFRNQTIQLQHPSPFTFHHFPSFSGSTQSSLYNLGTWNQGMWRFLSEIGQKRKQCFRGTCAEPPTDTQPQRHQVDSDRQCADTERGWPLCLYSMATRRSFWFDQTIMRAKFCT